MTDGYDECQVCGRQMQLRKDGTIWHHAATPAQHDGQVDAARGEMLRELLTALGDDLHARPDTPQQVWEWALDSVRAMAEEAANPAQQDKPSKASDLLLVPLVPDDAVVERVAKALHEHDGDWCPVTWQQLTENGRNDYREQARAALRALGEPQQDERPGFVGMFRGAPDLSKQVKDIARGREVVSDDHS